MKPNESVQPALLNHALKFGAVLSVISIIIVLLFYAVDYTLFATLGFVLIVFAMWIGFTIYAGIHYRRLIGGYLPYGQAFIHCLIVLSISGLIQMIFNFVLYNVIDPELPQKLTEVMSYQQQELLTKFGTPQRDIDEAIAKIPDQFTTVGLILGYIKSYFAYPIISLLVALITRKNKPETI